MRNINKLIDNVILLETVINELDNDNKAKKNQIEVVFHNTLTTIIEEYITVKSTVTYTDFINDVLDELRDVTEKTSIHKVLDIVENSLLNSDIKHAKINYNNARELTLYAEWVNNAALKTAIKAEDYNVALKSVIAAAKAAKNDALIAANQKLFDHINTKSIEDISTLIELAKIAKTRKQKAAKKAGK